MSRPLRVNRPGAWHHVTARGIERRDIFTNERDRRHWLELMPEFQDRFRLLLHAYVLMDNHFHLLVETPEPVLSAAMQWLQTSYSMWFNRKHQRVGPLFQGRYKGVVVEPESWAAGVSRYVHLNPVRISALNLSKGERRAAQQGLSPAPDPNIVRERLRQLREYRWSSYRAYIGAENRPPWLECERVLSLEAGRTATERREHYRKSTEAAVREGLPEKPWEHLIGQVALGTRQWWQKMRQGLSGSDREQPQWKAVRPRASWKSLVEEVSRARGLSWEECKTKRGDWGRDLAFYLGRRECGLTLRELGAHADGLDYATVSAAIKRISRRAQQERKFMKLIHTLSNNLKFET